MNELDVSKLIQLLPMSYHNLGFGVIILKSRFKYLFHLNMLEYKISENIGLSIINVLTGYSIARIYYKYNKIYIYKFNFSNSKHSITYNKLYMVFALFHELRHGYQHVRGKTFKTKLDKEDDANYFARCMMSKYFQEISLILEIAPLYHNRRMINFF